MEEVVVSPPVQECLDMQVDKVEGDANLTELKKPKKRRKSRSKFITKNKLLAKGEDTENANTTLGAIASVDQEMIVTSPAANGDGKSSISSTNAPDITASHDIIGPAAIIDQQMTVLSPAPVQECLVMETDKDEVSARLTKKQKKNRRRKLKVKRNKNLESLDKREGTENPGSLGEIASVDPKMMVLSTAATVEEKSSIPSTNATDQIASGFILSTKVHEAVSGEMSSGKTVTDSTTSKKRKRNQRAKNTVAGDVLSAKVDEIVSGEIVPDKAVTDNTTPKKKKRKKRKKKVAGDVLSAKVNEVVSGETVPSKTTTNNTTPKKKTADTTASKKKKRRKKSPLSGDILSKSENIQVKVNAIDVLSTTKVLDTKVTNKTELSDITNHNVDDKKGPKVLNSEIGASNTTSKQKTKKQKVDLNSSENKEMTKATPGKKLVIFELDGMLADIVSPSPKDVEADKYSHGEAVFKRPYLDGFLSFCFEKFNVGIWSSRMKKKNLDPVVDCLFGDLKKKLLFTWSGFHCRNSRIRTIEDRDKCIVFKELRKIWETNGPSWVKGTFNESNTLLLDDSPYKALLNPKHTGIFPTSYKYTDTNDDCLGPTGALRAYLEGFAAADDVRTYVDQNPFGQGPIDEMNRDWKYYSRVLKGQKLYCTSEKSSEGSAFELLADVADRLLKESEGSISSVGHEAKEQNSDAVVKCEEPEGSAFELLAAVAEGYISSVGHEPKEQNSDTVVKCEEPEGKIKHVYKGSCAESESMPECISLKLNLPKDLPESDDESFRFDNRGTKLSEITSKSRGSYRRITKMLTRYPKVTSTKDYELSNPMCGGVSAASKRRMVVHQSSKNAYIQGAGSESIVKNRYGDKTHTRAASNKVKFSINSFKVPELYFDLPETASIGSLKRKVMHAVKVKLGGELHVGILHEGKKVRDNNRTLQQMGISHNSDLGTLGFTLEPSIVEDYPSPIQQEPLLSSSSPITDVGYSNSSLSYDLETYLDDYVDKNQESVPNKTEKVADPKAVVPVTTLKTKAFSGIMVNYNPTKKCEGSQRRIRRPFSISEVEALVEAVEFHGLGKWREVKERGFDDAVHRTGVDLKDKWKTLVHTASIPPQQRRGELVPQHLLDRVLAAIEYWSKIKHGLKRQ